MPGADFRGQARTSGTARLGATSTTWQLRDESQQVRRSGKGVPPKFADLPPGRFFLERRAATDWEISAIGVPQPDKIENVKVSPEVLAEGKEAAVTWSSSKPAQVELLDAFGRVIGRASGQQQVSLIVGRPLTHSGFVRVTAGTAVQRVPVLFAASSRARRTTKSFCPGTARVLTSPGHQLWMGSFES